VVGRCARATGQAQLSPEERAYLAGLPRSAVRELDGTRCLFVHATPGDPLYRYLGPDPAAWAVEVGSLDANLVMVGHTHLQFELIVEGKRVVNPGSVGQPKDGDPRAAYAVLENGACRFGRMLVSAIVVIEDANSQALKGYGPVDAALSRELDPVLDEIGQALRAMTDTLLTPGAPRDGPSNCV
jgi:diadenosine tetraphosphatase ApaH/serine/threonine PP2A family protein phosphatase